MKNSRIAALIEEIEEVESRAELLAMVKDLQSGEYSAMLDDPSVIDALSTAIERFPETKEVVEPKVAPVVETPKVVMNPKPPMLRAGRRYRLLKTELEWTDTPQIHTVMAILAAHMKVGEVMNESEIVAAMEANVHALATKQGGKRIWDYYKGRSEKGLMSHGNIELA